MFSWLHNRVPAILTSAAQVQAWLDPKREGKAALDVLKPIKEKQVRNNHEMSHMIGKKADTFLYVDCLAPCVT